MASHDEINEFIHQTANKALKGPAWTKEPEKGIYYIAKNMLPTAPFKEN